MKKKRNAQARIHQVRIGNKTARGIKKKNVVSSRRCGFRFMRVFRVRIIIDEFESNDKSLCSKNDCERRQQFIAINEYRQNIVYVWARITRRAFKYEICPRLVFKSRKQTTIFTVFPSRVVYNIVPRNVSLLISAYNYYESVKSRNTFRTKLTLRNRRLYVFDV